MKTFHALNEVESKEMVPGFHGKLVHMENMTIAYWDVEAGSQLPEHAHFHEQTTNVIEGEFEMTIGGKTKTLTFGEFVTIPSNVTHSGKALTPCKIIDVFSPAREDYK